MLHNKRNIFKLNSSAFTLIELAIVLVIVGLITGGILGANSLVNSAKLNSAIGQISQYNTGLNAFKLEYDAMPGDFEDATDYSLHLIEGVDYGCRTFASSSNRYGNGDRLLSGYLQATNVRYDGEMQNYFVHLVSAGLINNFIKETRVDSGCNATYSGISNAVVAGVNYPEFPIGDGIIVVSDAKTKKLYYLVGAMGMAKNFHLNGTSSTSRLLNTLTPKESHKMDSKIDDKNPLVGKVKVLDRTSGHTYGGIDGVGTLTFDTADSSTGCIYNSVYNLSYDTDICAIAIEIPN